MLVSSDSPESFNFMIRPTLNFTVRFSGTLTRSRVLGFCAMRAARTLLSKTPKSRNSRRLPCPNSSMISSRKFWMIRLTTTRLLPVLSAIRSMSSFFVTVRIMNTLIEIRRSVRDAHMGRGRPNRVSLRTLAKPSKNRVTYTTANSSCSARIFLIGNHSQCFFQVFRLYGDREKRQDAGAWWPIAATQCKCFIFI